MGLSRRPISGVGTSPPRTTLIGRAALSARWLSGSLGVPFRTSPGLSRQGRRPSISSAGAVAAVVGPACVGVIAIKPVIGIGIGTALVAWVRLPGGGVRGPSLACA